MVFRFAMRAAFSGAALFIFITTVAAAPKASVAKSAETLKDIIEKSFNLSLQKDRPQAVNILVAAIKQESARNVDVAELKKALEQVSYIFYSERAQQTYELALSVKHSDASQARQKITEALRLEPDNRGLINEMLRLQMTKGDCGSALDGVTKERARDPYDEHLSLIQAQAYACLGNWDGYLKSRDEVDIKKSGLYKFWLSLEAEYNFAIKSPYKAKEAIAILQKNDSKYPELSYWQWRAASNKERAVFAQKYLKECSGISSGVYRQYMTDVNLCRRVTEVETARKNGDNPT